jgi:hypothetical protein
MDCDTLEPVPTGGYAPQPKTEADVPQMDVTPEV